MSATPLQLLELARELEKGRGEHRQRAACSRAYYAIFHTCLSFATAKSFIPQKVDGHEALIQFLTGFSGTVHEQRVARQAGHDMRRMRRLRVRADYNLSDMFESVDAQETIQKAERVLHRLKDK